MTEGRKHPKAKCEECPLLHRVGVRGRGKLDAKGHADVMIIGENPGTQEVIQRKVFIGPSGKMLSDLLRYEELETYWISNTCLCFDQEVKNKEVAAVCCYERLIDEIVSVRPKLIITLGNLPTKTLLGKGPGITKRRGQLTRFSVAGFETEVLPTVHPAAVLRNNKLMGDLEADLNYARGLLSAEGNVTVRPPNPNEIPYELTDDYVKVLRIAQESTFCVLDLETKSLDPVSGKILLMVLAPSDGDMIYLIPEHVIYSPGFTHAFAKATPNVKWSGHETKFDRNFIKIQLGITVDFSYDTLLAHYLLDERQGTHGAKEICSSMFRAPDWEGPLRAFFEGKKDRDYSTLPKEMLHTYAANDGYWQRIMTRELHRLLKPQERLVWVYKNLLMPGVRILSDAEATGILFDQQLVRELSPKYERRATNAYNALQTLVGHPFNPRSPQQVSRILFDELGLPEIDGRSTNAKTVLAVLEKQHPVARGLLDYREAYTIFSRYITGLQECVRADGRIHTGFHLAGTVTGRLSSSVPNLQNQPSRNKDAKKDIRSLFLADPGCMFVEADYSQLEYRMVAVLSQDPYLIQCYREGRDFHMEMAQEVWGPQATSDNRKAAKGVNFGLLYGRSAGGILRDGTLDLSPEHVMRITDEFFAKMPKVVEFNEGVKRQVLEFGYVESPLGRRRRFPELPYIINDQGKLNEAFRQAINMVSQSAASDATLASIIALDRIGLPTRITVHDSITICVPERDVQDASRALSRCMSDTATELYGDSIPFPVEVETGYRWGSLKEEEDE